MRHTPAAEQRGGVVRERDRANPPRVTLENPQGIRAGHLPDAHYIVRTSGRDAFVIRREADVENFRCSTCRRGSCGECCCDFKSRNRTECVGVRAGVHVPNLASVVCRNAHDSRLSGGDGHQNVVMSLEHVLQRAALGAPHSHRRCTRETLVTSAASPTGNAQTNHRS